MNKKYNLTELEFNLIEDVKTLTDKVYQLNKYLKKANGYGTEDISFFDLINNNIHLMRRTLFEAKIISESEFNKRFYLKSCYGEVITDLHNIKDTHTVYLKRKDNHEGINSMSEKEFLFLADNFGKSFNIEIQNLEMSKHIYNDIANIIDYNINIPAIMFHVIPEKEITTLTYI
jgi:hypothetical protein